MDNHAASNPKARNTGLLIDQVADETIVYDEERMEAHSLNRSASIVWTHSDGTRTVPELASLLGAELGTEVDETVIEYALDELTRVHLIEADPEQHAQPVSRRDAVRRLSAAGAATLVLPVILSIVAPTPAMASSGGSNQNDQGQNNNDQGQNQ